jgi:hypothetical protein
MSIITTLPNGSISRVLRSNTSALHSGALRIYSIVVRTNAVKWKANPRREKRPAHGDVIQNFVTKNAASYRNAQPSIIRIPPASSYNPQSAKRRAATHEGVLGMIPRPWNLPSCQLVSTANNVVAGQHKGRTILLFRWTIPSGKGPTSGGGKSNTGAILPHPFLALPFRPSVAAIYEVVVV